MVFVHSLAYILSHHSHLTPCEWYGLFRLARTGGFWPPWIEHINVNECGSTSDQFTAVFLKTQPAPPFWRSGRRLGEWNECKQVAVRERAAKQPLSGIFSSVFYTNYQV